jgi:hypothetical protein
MNIENLQLRPQSKLTATLRTGTQIKKS